MPRTPSPVSFRRFFRLIGGVVAATVGLIFLIIGINLLSSQSWATTTGTVQSCTSTTVSTGSGTSHHIERTCNVTWQIDGVNHTHEVGFGAQPVNVGKTYTIKVNGDSAVLPSPLWVALLTFLVGIGLVGLCVFMFIRSRRAIAPTSTP